MKIVEATTDFSRDVLSSVFFAASRHRYSERFVDDVETIIGKGQVARFFDMQLPDFDQGLQFLKQHGIQIAVDPFLEEIELGKLKITKGLETLIMEFSNDFLIFRGLSRQYQDALDLIGIPTNEPITKFDKNHPSYPIMQDYVQKAESMLRWLLPELSARYVEVDAGLPHRNLIPFGVNTKKGYSKYAEHLFEIYQTRDEAVKALEELAKYLKSDLPIPQKFYYYHNSMTVLANAMHGIAHHLSRFWMVDEQTKALNASVVSKATNFVRRTNAAIREEMPAVYSLRPKS